jgi:hypothetical protein
MNPRVSAVSTNDDFTLTLLFTNGEAGVFDCRPFLTFGVFQELQDGRYFKQAFVQHGTVAWPHEQDICPDTLYLESKRTKPAAEVITNP